MTKIKTPIYIAQENLLIKNLQILKNVIDKSGAKILLALKGYAMYSTFDIVSKYLNGIAASGINEATLGYEYFGKEIHTYSPAFSQEDITKVAKISTHVILNSFNQWLKYKDLLQNNSCGIRINPQSSTIKTDLYNPCGLYSRLGVTKKEFKPELLDNIQGFHFHALCEQNADALKVTLKSFEEKFGKYVKNLKWVNFGGGHHITRDDYDIELLIWLIKDFKKRYNNIDIYLEPSEAIGWQVGYLVATILDIVHNEIDIAIVDTSAESHMPDTLAMPYRPMIRNSYQPYTKPHTYRIAGNTCLAGDIMGDYSFDKKLQIGDILIFEDQIHYTFVINTTFNGINLPSLAIQKR